MNAVGVISFARIFTELKDLGYCTNKLIKGKQIVKVVYANDAFVAVQDSICLPFCKPFGQASKSSTDLNMW